MLHPVRQDANHRRVNGGDTRRVGVWRYTLVLAALFAGVAAFQAPAQAHADLVSSNPTDGATLVSPPRQLTLEFSEAINPDMAKALLTVTGSGGVETPVSRGARDTMVVMPMPDQGREAGRWRLDYRVVSVDGHPITGSLNFIVSPQAPAAQTSPSNRSPGSLGETSSASQLEVAADGEDASDQGWGFTAPAVIVLLVLILFGVVWNGRRKDHSTRARDN